jgi:cytochrome c oxidase cbb3-type subunit 3
MGIGGIGLPLNGEKIEHFPRDYLFKTIRHGRPGRVMPAFVELSDAQVDAVVDYILGWKQSADIPVFSLRRIEGNIERGKQIFASHCAACHGEDGKSEGTGTGVTVSRERKFKVVPPALNNPGFLASASDEWIKDTIVSGRPGTIMPSGKSLNLSDNDIDAVVSYIRSFETLPGSQASLQDEEPTLVFESPYDFITTVENLKQAMQGMNFRYFPDRYLEMGLADDNLIDRTQLSMRFCNFERLYGMINTEPRLGVVLPCRVIVVQLPDGQVQIMAMNMKVVSRLFNNDQLSESAEMMHEAILSIIDEATL